MNQYIILQKKPTNFNNLMKFLRIFLIPLCLIIFIQANEYKITEFRNKFDVTNQSILDGLQFNDEEVYFLTGTQVLKYDGKDLTVVKKISQNQPLYKRLVSDDSSNIWFFSNTNKNELIKYDGKSFESIAIPENVEEVIGLAIFHGRIFFVEKSGIIYSYESKKWVKYRLPEKFDFFYLTDLAIFESKLWISSDKGIFVYDDLSLKSGNKISGMPTYYIYEDTYNNELIFLMNNHIIIYSNGNYKKILTEISLAVHYRVLTPYINRISENKLAICSGLTHYVVNSETWEKTNLNEYYGIEPEISAKTFVDDFNNIWVCSKIGIIRINKPLFKTYTHRDGLLNNDVSALAKFDNSDLLLGQQNGLTLLRNGQFTKISLSNFVEKANSRVIDLLIDDRQRAWFLIQKLGIGRIDDINNPENIKWFNNINFQTMILLENGEIFVGAKFYFYKINDDEVSRVYNTTLEKEYYFRRILQENENIVTLVSNLGILSFDINKGKITNSNSEIPDMFSLEKSGLDLIVGGRKGLYRLVDGNYKRIHLTNNPDKIVEVYFINKTDNNNNFWIGTNFGLFRKVNGNIKNYNSFDGLGDDELNRSAFVYDNKNRKIWLGTIGGVSSFELDDIEDYNKKPKLTYNKSKSYVDNNEIFLSYSGSSLYLEPEIKYKIEVRSENLEYEKNIITMSDSIRFANLKSGKYEIKIVAVDRFSNTSKEIIVDYVVKTNAKIFLIGGLLVFGLVFLVYFYSTKRKGKKIEKNLALENLEPKEDKYNINVFGALVIYNTKFENVTHKLTPKLKELFLILLIHSFDERESMNGISSEKLMKVLWSDVEEKSLKNKRNLTIKRLREFLENEELGEIKFYNRKWHLELKKELDLDYFDWIMLKKKNTENNLSARELRTFFEIVNNNTFLSCSNSYDWLNDFQTWCDRETAKVLSNILRNENYDSNNRINAGRLMVSIDPINEIDIIYFIRLLNKLNDLSEAAIVFTKFNNEYRNLFGKNYKLSLDEILTEKKR